MTSRRSFLKQGGLWACSAAAFPLITPIALASAPWEERLVVIVLRGAMDGLDAIRPAGDPLLAGLRPRLSEGAEANLDGYWGLHPGLESLRPMWEAGQFGAVHAVSTPYRDRRSHFDGQDILEAGTVGALGEARRDGWLNRMLGQVPGLRPETAYAVGRDSMLILSGDEPVSRWSPEAQLNLSPEARRLIEIVTHEDPLFRGATEQALNIVDGLEAGEGRGGTTHLRIAEFVAARLRGETRIASFSVGGWDTHGQQENGLRRPLAVLSESLLALQAGLGPVWDRTAVICLTEFGRTARENGTIGTDHGTGGAMLFAGGALRGGRVLADWPGLNDLYVDRDLMPTRDLRAHAGWVMRGLFGLERSLIETTLFPGLDLGDDPGLLA